MEKIVVNGEGLTLDLILYRRFGRRAPSLVARTLKLNPGLAAEGLILAFGREIILPDVPTRRDANRRPAVNLFS